MATPIRVTGAWVQLLGDWLDRQGLPASQLRGVLQSFAPSDVVPMRQWGALLDQALALCPNHPAPGLEIGAMVQPRHVGVLGYLVLACATLGEALLSYQRYERLFYNADIADVAAIDDEVEVRWGADVSAGYAGDSVAIAALVAFARKLAVRTVTPTLVGFVFAAPKSAETRAAYRKFFGCRVRFGESHTRLRLTRSQLDTPMAQSDPALRELLDAQARTLLKALPQTDAFDGAIQHTIVRLLPDGDANLASVARALHVSARTLQRRLAAHGLTWQAYLDRTRSELARNYLADPALTLADIAMLLGYSEQSAFNRAYRRWTQQTPARMRRTDSVLKRSADDPASNGA